MVIKELFADRERRRLGSSAPDVLAYELPARLRHQVVYLIRECFGDWSAPSYTGVFTRSSELWIAFDLLLRKEVGVPALGRSANPQRNVEEYFLRADDLDALSVVELAFQAIVRLAGGRESTCEQVKELNARFRQHSVGYAFVSGEIMRVDTTYTHDEMVKPALVLLSDAAFNGANDEFLTAHKHYREGRLKEAINEALKAFESTMKCICKVRGITYEPKWQAKQLIATMISAGVVPDKLESEFTGLRSCLESGLPTVRNRDGAHGQGQQVVEPPLELVTFAIHMAAANIVFLVESHLATFQT